MRSTPPAAKEPGQRSRTRIRQSCRMAIPTTVSSNAILTASKSQEGAAPGGLSTSEGESATGLWKHSMPHLELKNLTQRFGSQTALDGLNLSIEKGELISLLGPSGCGKTTTIRLIAGFLEPTRGSVWIGGRDVTPLPPEQRNIGMVFQSYALFPHLNVFENVAFGLKAAKVPRPQIESRVQRALELVNLPNYGKRPVFELSGGEQQRVAIARAVVIEPQILLLDEPLSNLDASLRERTRRQLRELITSLGITTAVRYARPGRSVCAFRPYCSAFQRTVPAGRNCAGALRPSSE